jgi:hypothetical protein
VEAAPYLHRPSSCTRISPGTIGPPAQFTLQPTFFDQLRNYPLLCFFSCLILPRSFWKNSVVDRKTTTVGQLKLYEDDGLIVREKKAQKRLRIVNDNLALALPKGVLDDISVGGRMILQGWCETAIPCGVQVADSSRAQFTPLILAIEIQIYSLGPESENCHPNRHHESIQKDEEGEGGR